MPSITKRGRAWVLFDHIVRQAAETAAPNPWGRNADGKLVFQPDYSTLETLLGVPLYLAATTQSGVPALALDVWLSYELRRAGFGEDQVWPRPSAPRILPPTARLLVDSLPQKNRKAVWQHIKAKPSIPGVTSASASILGKNYRKQVDVIMSDWATGPELLISTKRMDSSYGKNAPNRIEESYGDAKNLRLRHPLAATGFLFALNADILRAEPSTAEWLFDLLEKLAKEEDAYHATCVVLMDYPQDYDPPDELGGDEGIEEDLADQKENTEEDLQQNAVQTAIDALPAVRIAHESIPDPLRPDRFLAEMVCHVLVATPVDFHRNARTKRAEA